jgi:hypothetical protein
MSRDIFILMNTQLSTMQSLSAAKPHFSLTSESLGGGLTALHLNVKHLPGDFLGVAFHLPISGGEWSFEGSQLGSDWATQEQNLLTLTSVSEGKPRELVFGLSLKGNTGLQTELLHDGSVATFFVKTGGGDYKAEFQRAVLSLEVEGNRVDTGDVFFDGVTFSSDFGESEGKVFSSALSGQEGAILAHPMASQELFGTQETDVLGVQPGFVQVLGTNVMAQNPYESVFQVYWVTFFFVVVLLAGAALAYICHRLLERKR